MGIRIVDIVLNQRTVDDIKPDDAQNQVQNAVVSSPIDSHIDLAHFVGPENAVDPTGDNGEQDSKSPAGLPFLRINLTSCLCNAVNPIQPIDSAGYNG